MYLDVLHIPSGKLTQLIEYMVATIIDFLKENGVYTQPTVSLPEGTGPLDGDSPSDSVFLV